MPKKWRWISGITVALVGGAFAFDHFQAQIGIAVFARGAEDRVGRNIVADLPDGLHVAFCGTSSPLPNRERAGACTVVIAGKRIIVVDAGEGGARNISLMGIPSGKIERLFLTHFHSDHIDGLGPMMLLRWTGNAATAPLPVHGPKGVDDVIAGFNAAYAQDNGYRTAHHGADIAPPAGAGAAPVPFELTDNATIVFNDDGLKVTAFRVAHDPASPAVGYRFDYQGRSAVISGDTARSVTLERAAKGADLLVHDALQPKLVGKITAALDRKGIRNTAKITRDIIGYHASPEEVAQSAAKAGVVQVVLTHVVPALPSRFFYPAFIGDAHKYFGGEIIVGEDGLFFSLPAGSRTIDRKELM
jgi:ribonuclease Z